MRDIADVRAQAQSSEGDHREPRHDRCDQEPVKTLAFDD